MLTEGGIVLTGAEIEKMSEEELAGIVDHVDSFARVSPQHKTKDRGCLQAARACGGDDRRRCQRCAGAQTGQHRDRHGHHRHRRDQRDCRHGADRRQLRQHRLGHRRGAGDLLQHPQVRLLPDLLQYRRDSHHLPLDAGWPADPAASDPIAVPEPRHRRRAGVGAGHGEGRPRHHDAAAAPDQGAGDQQRHAGRHHRHPDCGRDRRSGRFCHGPQSLPG